MPSYERKKKLTQRNIADALGIQNKTVSKWECGLGCPDLSLWPELSTISLVLVCSVIWLFAYSIMRSTKLYTVLGYGAASAAVVQKKFICNIVFLIVIAVAANIVGKMKKK